MPHTEVQGNCTITYTRKPMERISVSGLHGEEFDSLYEIYNSDGRCCGITTHREIWQEWQREKVNCARG